MDVITILYCYTWVNVFAQNLRFCKPEQLSEDKSYVARYAVAFAGCSEADRLQEPLSSEETTLNNAVSSYNDAAEPGSVTQLTECSDSASCMTLSPPTAESSKLVTSTGTDEEPLKSTDIVNDLCTEDSCVSRDSPAEKMTCEQPCCSVSEWITSASERQPVSAAQSSSMDSSDVACSEYLTATGQKTEGGSASVQNQYSSSSAKVKSNSGAEKCRCSSDTPALSQKCSTQSSIRSFFAPSSKRQPDETGVRFIENNTKPASSQSPQNCAVLFSHSQPTDANSAVNKKGSGFRKCPFYKWIPGKVSYSSWPCYCSCVVSCVLCMLWKIYDDITALCCQFIVLQLIRYTKIQ